MTKKELEAKFAALEARLRNCEGNVKIAMRQLDLLEQQVKLLVQQLDRVLGIEGDHTHWVGLEEGGWSDTGFRKLMKIEDLSDEITFNDGLDDGEEA